MTLYHGTGRFTGERGADRDRGHDGSTSVLTADQFVLAAGSRPIVPDIPGLRRPASTPPRRSCGWSGCRGRLGIIGGGFVAAELAHVFSSLGVDVTLIVRSDLLLGHEDREIAERYTEIAQGKYDVRLEHEMVGVSGATTGSCWRCGRPDGTDELVVDELLVAVGRTPNSDVLNVEAAGVEVESDGRVIVDEYQQTAAEGVYALGDIVRRTSSSTSPTTRRGWCSTTCCTPTTGSSPTTATYRTRSSVRRRSRRWG